jgi:ribosome-binding protein aMBF1 (putative translation factor)
LSRSGLLRERYAADPFHARSGQFLSSDEIQAIVAAVRDARGRHGLSQTDLAGLSGTGLRFVSALERGKSSVSLHKVVAVLSVVRLRLHVLERDG